MRYWPSSELSRAPGMHPHAAYELSVVNRTGLISSQACEAGYMAAIHEIVPPYEVPLVLPPTLGVVAAQPFYLRMPDPWEFHKLERAGLVNVHGGYYFISVQLH